MKKMNLFGAAAVAFVASLSFGASSMAAVTYIGASRPCATTDITGATACAGFYTGNGIAGTSNASDNRLDAFTRLGLAGPPTIIDSVDAASGDSSGVIDFGQLLSGMTVISAHWGAGTGGPGVKVKGGVSGMYVFNFAVPTATVTTPFGSTWSNARLFSTGGGGGGGGGGGPGPIPEPATWAMMILGFGAAGTMLRRRRAALA